MGFIASLIKSSKLRKLQTAIGPKQGASPADSFADMVDTRKADARAQALEDYLDLCEGDENVAFVMQRYGLQRADLTNFYRFLCASGGGGWVKGHYTPLSSIAYGEPLIFLAETRDPAKWSPSEVAYQLMIYWNGELGQGGLIALLKQRG